MGTEVLIREIINGRIVHIKDEQQKKEIQKRLREIKNNCTSVLAQLKNN